MNSVPQTPPSQRHIEAKRLAESGAFDFLIADKRPILKTTEVAACLGRGGAYVISLIEEGKLEAHALPDRQKKRYTITRRSALLHLADTAEYDPGDFPKRLKALLALLPPAQRQALVREAVCTSFKDTTQLGSEEN